MKKNKEKKVSILKVEHGILKKEINFLVSSILTISTVVKISIEQNDDLDIHLISEALGMLVFKGLKVVNIISDCDKSFLGNYDFEKANLEILTELHKRRKRRAEYLWEEYKEELGLR